MNKDYYKKALDQIHASDELKNSTLEEIRKRKNRKYNFYRYATILVVAIIICTVYFINFRNPDIQKIAKNSNEEIKEVEKIENDLPRFASMEELRNVLENNNSNSRQAKSMNQEILDDTVITSETQEQTDTSSDYSMTNVQVDGVDEADIVKTDGEFIYYISNQKIYILSKNLELISTIDNINNEKEKFIPKELYINNDKLIILGNYSKFSTNNISNKNTEIIDIDESQEILTDDVIINSENFAKAMVYDINKKDSPKLIREVGLDGFYINSRMINDNIYFVSSKNILYNNNLKDEEILPYTEDSIRDENKKMISYSDIAYFKDVNTYNYMIVGGFNINNSEEVQTETFFGASDNIYANKENLYITELKIENNMDKTIIYKFKLGENGIILECKGEVEGYLNNQFSMDEYEGNLRVATTISKNEIYYDSTDTTIVMGTNQDVSNKLTILDDNLKEIGKIENMAQDEKIYAVRFIGKIGYIVTFKQTDPLFVIDLSDPTNPIIKGELKIPGYSSYLHPYDDTHIIGIGYNTKENSSGGIVNTNMKISMFDISDLENPREMYTMDIGEKYVYSELEYNHKALFINKDKNLIGFPLTYNGKNSFILIKINLENGFEKYNEITKELNYKTNINRGIYINSVFYTLAENEIISYDLNTMKEQNKLELN